MRKGRKGRLHIHHFLASFACVLFAHFAVKNIPSSAFPIEPQGTQRVRKGAQRKVECLVVFACILFAINHLPLISLNKIPAEHFQRGFAITRAWKTNAYCAVFLASSKNLARPISVSGCLSRPRMESSGQVHTSAPASAALMMWSALRIDAARISVLKP